MYCTLDQAKSYLSIPAGTTADDEMLTDFIARAQGYIEKRTGRVFEAASGTREIYRDDVDGLEILIRDDLASITEIKDGVGNIISTTDYAPTGAPIWRIEIRPGSGKSWQSDADGVVARITGMWGFSVSPPALIVQICTRLAARYYRHRDTAADLSSVFNGGEISQVPSAMPAEIEMVLAGYREGAYY